ncbi:MAG: phytanoyl-CoA dioxygenase [Acidobacteriales bacterium 59-55]|nr:phytanoyl-CoA dioxygenase family protein [Terriglobales bacterium]OJV44013.1 MAG: phytanoyl-CoA dioxygenase [Acidobacteriales bacterium 59-55]
MKRFITARIDMAKIEKLHEELDAPFSLTGEQIHFYNENGYVKLGHVLSPELLDHYSRVITERVAELSADAVPLEQRTTYGKAFLQIMNLWTQSDQVREFVFGKCLARIAAELIDATGVRLYHDQALYKEAGGGITPWHADQYYWPVSSDKMVTAWIPLQETPLEMGPLAFCEKSHRFQIGRDLEISDESEMTLKQALQTFHLEESAFSLGDVSFHSGWTFHRAGANSTDRPRKVMTMIYMDEKMRLAAPRNKNQIADTERWCPGAEVGEVIASPLNPVIYSRNEESVTTA